MFDSHSFTDVPFLLLWTSLLALPWFSIFCWQIWSLKTITCFKSPSPCSLPEAFFPPFQFTIISFHEGGYHMQHLSAPGQKQLSCHTIWEESTSPMPQRVTLQLQWLRTSLRQSVEQVWYKFAQGPLKIKTWCLRSFVCAAPAIWHKDHHWSLWVDYTTQSDRGAGHSSLSRRQTCDIMYENHIYLFFNISTLNIQANAKATLW